MALGSALTALIHSIGDPKKPTPNYEDKPEAALRFVYDCWVERGGFDSGKRRHSVRQIKSWLGKNEIRSLETKLAGKTRLQQQDALNLLRVILQRWTYCAVGNSHKPYQEGNLDTLAEQLVRDLFPGSENTLMLPERSKQMKSNTTSESIRRESQPTSFDQTMASYDTIRSLFSKSEVMITISRERAVIGRDPHMAMTGFHNMMETLMKIAEHDRRQRAVVWILDLGLRNDKNAARGAIYNLFFLAAQFESIALINRDGVKELWKWLHANTCFIVGSLKRSEIDEIYETAGLDLPLQSVDLRWFQPDRLFLESVPGRWLDQPGSEAFGARQGDLWRSPTITAHLRLNDWDLDHSMELDVRKNLRYLYHGNVTDIDEGLEATRARCINLSEPGSRWSDAYRLAIQAVFGRLGRHGDERVSSVSPHQALAQLRDSSFATLNLSEFLHLPEFLIDRQILTASEDNSDDSKPSNT